ncbi:hypothetical protein BLOT_008689 [Blomia tropicalis]|nr:hypothetical protein BLOT_008689 [Blomia tropicalis]
MNMFVDEKNSNRSFVSICLIPKFTFDKRKKVNKVYNPFANKCISEWVMKNHMFVTSSQKPK